MVLHPNPSLTLRTSFMLETLGDILLGGYKRKIGERKDETQSIK